MFEGFDFTDFWDDDEYSKEAYIEDPPTDELIAEIEKELGYKLPASYIWLMKQHNGGLVKKAVFPPKDADGDGAWIEGIMGIGRKKSCSLCGELGNKNWLDEWEYPPIGIAICDTPSGGHDMIFLDYRECGNRGEPKVVRVDQEMDYDITPVADNFEEFICGLIDEETYEKLYDNN